MKINKEILFEILILFGFGLFMMRLLYTGQISMYIHPRMNIYVLLCSIYFIIIGIFNIKDLVKVSNKKTNMYMNSLFLIALCMAIIIKPATISASQDIMKNKGVNIAQGSTGTNNNLQDSNPADTTNGLQYKDEAKLNIENGVTKIGENSFVTNLDEIFTNTDKYKGKYIEISGFVYREKGFLENNFVIGRLYMVCCSADSQIVGIMCHFKNAKTLKTQSWINVKGTINVVNYNGEKVPIIEVKETKNIDKPQNEYVYN